MYDSGDWDVDQRMPANMINSLIEYTTLRVDPKSNAWCRWQTSAC